jgi:hypothetical protein
MTFISRTLLGIYFFYYHFIGLEIAGFAVFINYIAVTSVWIVVIQLWEKFIQISVHYHAML